MREGSKATEEKNPDTLAENFGISPRVRAWAEKNGYTQLDKHLEHFVGYAKAKDARYADWDQALQNAIREDWAKLRSHGKANGTASHTKPPNPAVEMRRSCGLPAEGIQ